MSSAPAAGSAGGQVVGGVVEEQFARPCPPTGPSWAVRARSASKVTQTVEHGVSVTTITPIGDRESRILTIVLPRSGA